MELQNIAIKTVCRNSIAYFVAHYLKQELPLKIPEFHLEIYRDLAESSLTRLCIRAPTGFAKTTVVGLAFPVWLGSYGICKRIIYLSATASFAERRLRDVKGIFEGNDKIHQDFGVTPGDIWRDNEITLSNGVNVLALGSGSQLTGERPDCIIGDDLETEEDVKSEVKRESLAYWWDATVMNRPTPDGRVILIGSRSSPLAFLSRFDKPPHNKIWVLRDYGTKNCKSIWPEKWTDRYLQQKKDELSGTPGLYPALYEGDVSQIAKYAFRKDWLRYYDKVPQGLRVFTAVDLGAGENEGNSYTAIVTIGIDPNSGAIYVLDFIKRRYNVETLEMFGAMFLVYEVYRPIRFGIESVAFQRYIKQFFEKECRERGKTPNVIELKRDTQISKDFRIRSLSHWFEEGKIFIRPDQYALIAEYEAYPEVGSADGLDALSMAVNDMAMPGKLSVNTGQVRRPEIGIGNRIN